MRVYWDSSALVAAALDMSIRDRVTHSKAVAVTRTRALCEVFSTLTGSRLGFRVDANDAARLLRDLFEPIEVVELSAAEVMEALGEARSKGVRGGQVHDYLHAVAARRAECETLLTLNCSDFEGLCEEFTVESP